MMPRLIENANERVGRIANEAEKAAGQASVNPGVVRTGKQIVGAANRPGVAATPAFDLDGGSAHAAHRPRRFMANGGVALRAPSPVVERGDERADVASEFLMSYPGWNVKRSHAGFPARRRSARLHAPITKIAMPWTVAASRDMLGPWRL